MYGRAACRDHSHGASPCARGAPRRSRAAQADGGRHWADHGVRCRPRRGGASKRAIMSCSGGRSDRWYAHARARLRRVARWLRGRPLCARSYRRAGCRPRGSVGRSAACAATEGALVRPAREASGTPFIAAGSAGMCVHQLDIALHLPRAGLAPIARARAAVGAVLCGGR